MIYGLRCLEFGSNLLADAVVIGLGIPVAPAFLNRVDEHWKAVSNQVGRGIAMSVHEMVRDLSRPTTPGAPARQ